MHRATLINAVAILFGAATSLLLPKLFGFGDTLDDYYFVLATSQSISSLCLFKYTAELRLVDAHRTSSFTEYSMSMGFYSLIVSCVLISLLLAIGEYSLRALLIITIIPLAIFRAAIDGILFLDEKIEDIFRILAIENIVNLIIILTLWHLKSPIVYSPILKLSFVLLAFYFWKGVRLRMVGPSACVKTYLDNAERLLYVLPSTFAALAYTFMLDRWSHGALAFYNTVNPLLTRAVGAVYKPLNLYDSEALHLNRPFLLGPYVYVVNVFIAAAALAGLPELLKFFYSLEIENVHHAILAGVCCTLMLSLRVHRYRKRLFKMGMGGDITRIYFTAISAAALTATMVSKFQIVFLVVFNFLLLIMLNHRLAAYGSASKKEPSVEIFLTISILVLTYVVYDF